MSFPALDDYLRRLPASAGGAASLWSSPDGQAHGQFLNCVLTSAFQPIRALGQGTLLGFEGVARGVADEDAGLSLWRLLDHSCGDDESIELDRLCRMLHSINFFRQPQAAQGDPQCDRYLSVHDRLLSAVSSNHGYAFRRILGALGLPGARIVLQMPAVGPGRRWLANYVADNYRRNGFRLAFNTPTVADAGAVISELRPYAVKIDAAVADDAALPQWLALAKQHETVLIFKKLHSSAMRDVLEQASSTAGVRLYGQGRALDTVQARLHGERLWPAPDGRADAGATALAGRP
ncbi:EAL domain-containing protein [Massilia sp. PWRC2]|uniref:EAL domain-containing protein n=1 Tax=Massilia sp. PWRC2 TaxID=2804626 RepID=UPI003CF84D17